MRQPAQPRHAPHGHPGERGQRADPGLRRPGTGQAARPTSRSRSSTTLAEGGEKITAAKVKAKRQEAHEATGEGGPVPRTLKQLRAFLEGKTGPADPGHKLAAYLLDYLAGKRSEEAMDKYWDRAFAEPAGHG